MIELVALGVEAGRDTAPVLAVGELSEGHVTKLILATESFDVSVTIVAPYASANFVQKVAIGDPASRFARVAMSAPSVDSSRHKVIDFGRRLGTDNVQMIGCPTAEHQVELGDERIRRSAFLAFTNGSGLLLDALETGLAGRDLQFCRFPDISMADGPADAVPRYRLQAEGRL